MLTRLGRCIGPATAFVLFGIGAARADVIDGDWCDTGSRHFSIRGSEIVTPDGTKTTGNYSRHAFSYTVPQPDPGAGAQIFMNLVNELTVRLHVGADPNAPVQVWKRCEPIS